MTTVSQEAREARIARYLSNEKAARESLAAYPESTRQRLKAWQTEQSEWFSDTILEIVAEFITIDDAIRQSAERGEVVAWMYERKGFAPAVSMRDPRLRYSDIEALHPLYTLPTPPEAGA